MTNSLYVFNIHNLQYLVQINTVDTQYNPFKLIDSAVIYHPNQRPIHVPKMKMLNVYLNFGRNVVGKSSIGNKNLRYNRDLQHTECVIIRTQVSSRNSAYIFRAAFKIAQHRQKIHTMNIPFETLPTIKAHNLCKPFVKPHVGD